MRIRRPMALGILVLTADQLTKQLFKDADRVLLPGVLNLSGTRNTGAAFGLFGGGQGALGLVTGAIILGLLVYICARKPQGLLGIGLWLAISGALGNLADRLLLGYVIDFIRLRFVEFPVFNLADVALTLGCGLAAASVLLEKPRHG